MQAINDNDTALFAAINKQRADAGYLTLHELLALAETDNVVFDPFSTLISRLVTFGDGNQFFPNCHIKAMASGAIAVGSSNTFYANSSVISESGPIIIGDGNQFGEGSFSAKTDISGASLLIGDQGRYVGQVAVSGRSNLGNGCQILGQITVRDCHLASGQAHTHPVADQRGAVLKGFGAATGIKLLQGEVIKGCGEFAMAGKKMQSFYHPVNSPIK